MQGGIPSGRSSTNSHWPTAAITWTARPRAPRHRSLLGAAAPRPITRLSPRRPPQRSVCCHLAFQRLVTRCQARLRAPGPLTRPRPLLQAPSHGERGFTAATKQVRHSMYRLRRSLVLLVAMAATAAPRTLAQAPAKNSALVIGAGVSGLKVGAGCVASHPAWPQPPRSRRRSGVAARRLPRRCARRTVWRWPTPPPTRPHSSATAPLLPPPCPGRRRPCQQRLQRDRARGGCLTHANALSLDTRRKSLFTAL